MRREVEANLAEHAAAAMKLEEVMAMLGAELVGSDAYSQAWELVPLVLAGEHACTARWQPPSSGAAGECWRRALCRLLCDSVRLRRPLGPSREPYSRTVATLPGSVEMFARGCEKDARLQRLRHGAYRVHDVHAVVARRGRTLKQWLASDPAAKLGRGFLWGVPSCRGRAARSWRSGCDEGPG